MKAVGFDFDHGRLDTSAHPFCGGTPADVRMTTRYRDEDFMDAMMGVLHETGHALYEQGLPKDYARQPVGLARGMVLHESQSLTIEMQVVRSRAFMDYAAPMLAKAFGKSGPGVERARTCLATPLGWSDRSFGLRPTKSPIPPT